MLLDALPAWLGILMFTLVPAFAAVGAHAVFRRYVPAKELIAHHEVAGFLVAVVGVLYAVVLGFIVVMAWEAFDTAQRNADAEAGVVGELFVLSDTFPEPSRTKLRRELSDYAYEVRDVEWPMLSSGKQDHRARELAVEAFETVTEMPWKTQGVSEAVRESVERSATLSDFHELGVRRRQRMLDALGGLDSVLYFALVLGGLMVLAFAFLFGVERAVPQLLMTGLLAGLIGLLIGLIAEFDRPFGAAIRVSPEAWTLVIDNNGMEHYASTPHAAPAEK
jgi:hypothetical protein